MTLDEGATHEINSRWPEHAQRNAALVRDIYGPTYYGDLIAGIQLVRDHYAQLKAAGETEWSIPAELETQLDQLATVQ